MATAILIALFSPLIVLPAVVGLLLIGVLSVSRPAWAEMMVAKTTTACILLSCLATLVTVCLMYWEGDASVRLGSLVIATGAHHHPLEFLLVLDWLSAPFLIATEVLGLIVAFFSANYLYRDRGHTRFFFLVLFFTLGMQIIVLGASLEVIFVGWEIIGLSSALLISFFYERASTADNALRAFWAYRLSDTALLLASIIAGLLVQHEHLGSGGKPIAPPILAILLIVAAMPKSAQFPFCGWLPRAMEGPTPSSAIFYGGLSVHAGLYLLLRSVAWYELPPWFYVILVIVGLTTALYGSLTARIQTDIKGALAYASMCQIGLMFAEVGAGFHRLALFHFLGHAMLRTYQILNAGSLLHEGRFFSKSPSPEDALNDDPSMAAWLYSFVFDLSLRDSGGPYSVVSGIERISRSLSALEDAFAERASNVVRFAILRWEMMKRRRL